MPLRVIHPDGRIGDPQSAVTPILVQVEPGLLRVVGTGFYVTRYGLFLTAKHVVEEVIDQDRLGRPTFAWNWTSDGRLFLRPVVTCAFLQGAPRDVADIAVCQAVASARNGEIRFDVPNERIAIVTDLPEPNTQIGTYAYPGNERVDFRGPNRAARIFADVYEGRLLNVLGGTERFLRYEHVETSIDIRAGASGGPVFMPLGHAFAVNCRGWNFGTETGSEPLSSVVPLRLILGMSFAMPHLPRGSAEDDMVPRSRVGTPVTLRDLAGWGHLVIDP